MSQKNVHIEYKDWFWIHEAPDMGNIEEGDPKRERLQLLVVLGFSYFDLRADFASSHQSLFLRGLSQHQSNAIGHDATYNGNRC